MAMPALQSPPSMVAAVGTENLAVGVQHRLDAAPRLHGIHVGRQHHRRLAGGTVGTGKRGHQVAIVVVPDDTAQVGQDAGQVRVDGILLPGGAVNLDQVDKGLGKALSVGHGKAPERGVIGLYRRLP